MFDVQRCILLLGLLFVVSSGATAEDSSTEAYTFLEQSVTNSRQQQGYHLDVRYKMTSPEREGPGTIVSKGVFRQPGAFFLQTQTLSGMQVKSYGEGKTIVHINPSTYRPNTSEQLGITSVDRTLLDPFRHFELLLKPDYEGFTCSFDGEDTIDGETYRVVRVTPGPKQIRDVINKFRDHFDRPVKPDQTNASYRVFIDPEKKRIRRMKIEARTQMTSNNERKGSDTKNSGSGDSIDIEELEEKTPDAGDQKNSDAPVTMTLDGDFNLTKYNEELSFDVPSYVQEKLTEWGSKEERK